MEEKKGKCCFSVNLRIVCFIVGYLQLALYVSGTVTTGYMMYRLLKDLPLDNQKMLNNIIGALTIGQMALPIGILISKFTIILLVGLHANSRIRIATYLFFATIMLPVMVASSILFSFSLSFSIVIIGLNVISIYVNRMYYKQLDPVDPKLIKETV